MCRRVRLTVRLGLKLRHIGYRPGSADLDNRASVIHDAVARRKEHAVQRYLISFDDGSMDHIPEEDWAAVGEAAHAVVREAKAAGV